MLRLSGCIFKSFLLATVQNHGGRVVAHGQPVPTPWGQVQNTKRESQIQNGVGGFNKSRSAGAGLAHSLTLAPRILKDTDCKSL